MKGYKGTDKDMKCRGMQYEVGKVYCVDTPVELCRHGLHFCESLMDVFEFYEADKGNRFFEVEAYGQLVFGSNKVAAEYLKIVRELEPKEVSMAKYGDGYGYGDGDGYAYGGGYYYDYGDGYGYGYGEGNGEGNGRGYGYDYGDDYNIQKILLVKN